MNSDCLKRATCGRLLRILLLAFAVSCAPAGCRDEPAHETPPDGGIQHPPTHDMPTNDIRTKADVVFDGTAKSITMLQVERIRNGITVFGPPGMVIAGVDPRFLLVVEVTSVLKGDAAKGWVGEKAFAIHSPARDLGMSWQEAPAGKRCRFYLFGQKDGAAGNVSFSGILAEPSGRPAARVQSAHPTV